MENFKLAGSKNTMTVTANNMSISVHENEGREITALMKAHSKEEQSIPNYTMCQLPA